MVKLGISSGSVPRFSSVEIVDIVKSLNCSTVDLRAERMHEWEKQGIDVFLASNIAISYIGTSIILGEKPNSFVQFKSLKWIQSGFPIKLLASPMCLKPDRIGILTLQIDMLTELLGDVGSVYIETHRGYANIQDIVKICEKFGTRIVIDTLGLVQIEKNPVKIANEIQNFVYHAQVKGFNWESPFNTRHLPLASSCFYETVLILESLKNLRSITVESKSNSLEEDLTTLHNWMKRG